MVEREPGVPGVDPGRVAVGGEQDALGGGGGHGLEWGVRGRAGPQPPDGMGAGLASLGTAALHLLH